MVRLLLSNKDSGIYEYSFEPLVEQNIKKAVSKFMKKYGFIKRIKLYPCDNRIRKLSLVLMDKDKRLDFKVNCCDRLCLEHTEFIVDVDEAVNKIKDMLSRVLKEYEECAKQFSEKLVL